MSRELDVVTLTGKEYDDLVAKADLADRLDSEVQGVIEQLERWALESTRYGWSTHQVKPQQDLAAKLRIARGW